MLAEQVIGLKKVITRPGHEIAERHARFSIKIQYNFKLILDYPSDLPGFRL